MSDSFSMKDARNHFNQMINAVTQSGKEVIITKARKPIAKIVPLEKKKRKLGLLKGKQYFISLDFDQESDAINQLFYGDGD